MTVIETLAPGFSRMLRARPIQRDFATTRVPSVTALLGYTITALPGSSPRVTTR